MATKITVELVHEGELPRFAVHVLEMAIDVGGWLDDPSQIMAWLAEHVADDPSWIFTATLNEEEGSATE